MAKIIDELVTVYKLDDQYTPKAKQVGASTQQLGGIMGSLGTASSGILGGVALGVTAVATVMVTATKAAIEFGVAAVQAFREFDTIERSFTGVLGSGERAGKMMEYLESKALKSAFGLKDLATAASSLAMASLDVNRFLPIVEQLALASGNVSGSGLADAASVLRRLRGGQIAEALGPEGLGRFGINRQDLTQYGATFNKQGQFQGSMEEAFDVVERVVAAKLGRVADEVGKGAEATYSNAADAWDKALRDAGRVVQSGLTPVIVGLTGVLNDFNASGTLVAVLEGFKGLGTLSKQVNWDALTGGLMAATHIAVAMGKLAMSFATKRLGALFEIPGIFNEMQAGMAQSVMTFAISRARRAGSDPVAPSVSPTEDYIKEVADNTEKVAVNTQKLVDHSRHIFGGNDLGRLGVTPVEIGSSRGSTRVQVDLTGVEGDWKRVMEPIVLQITRQIMQAARA